MAAQTDVSPLDFTAETVGYAFVEQFYHTLHKSPELVYRFYQDSSTMSRPGPDGKLATVTAMEGIKDLMLSLDCQDCKTEVLTADAQASYMEGVIVLVTGCLTGKDNVRRNFTESFFLAPQDKGFFVLNDTFRFIKENSSSEVISVEEKVVDKSVPVPQVIPTESKLETAEASDVAVNYAPAAEAATETVSVSKDEDESTVTEKAIPSASVDSGSKVQQVAENNGHVDVPKKSYASLLKNMNGGEIQTHKPKTTLKAATVKTTQKNGGPTQAVPQARPTTVPAAVFEASAPNDSNGNVAVQAEEKGHSVYVGNLPYDITVAQVEQEFKRFGPIKRNGIQVRSNKDFCFGFVEFEDATGKEKALDTYNIHISGKKAFIEEKKTDTRVQNGVVMYPNGRNGYRNDGFRGRGIYSNGGRGNYPNGGRGNARNDYGKRNEEVSSRGSRNGDEYVYQSGGGRGARQGAAPKK